tara:strand:+ start:390 stop:713 length:324 start_codon:yes stop_codon:yes gene_type:complete
MNTLPNLPIEIIDKINGMAREMEILELNKNKFKSTINRINKEFDWLVKSGNCELVFNSDNSGLRIPEDHTLYESMLHEGEIGDRPRGRTGNMMIIYKNTEYENIFMD